MKIRIPIVTTQKDWAKQETPEQRKARLFTMFENAGILAATQLFDVIQADPSESHEVTLSYLCLSANPFPGKAEGEA